MPGQPVPADPASEPRVERRGMPAALPSGQSLQLFHLLCPGGADGTDGGPVPTLSEMLSFQLPMPEVPPG